MTAEVKKRRFAEGTQVASPTDLSAGGSGSGEKNYILNTSDSTNWGESTDGQVDVSTTTTLTELPREFTTESGIKIVGTGAVGTDEYVYYRFSLDDADLNRKLSIKFAQKPIAGYADGELTVEMHYNAQSDYLGAYTELTVPNSDITDKDGDAIYTFDTDGTGIYYEFRVNKPLAATTTGVVISDVIVGPGKVIPGAVIGEWESFTPTGNWTTNTTYTGFKRRVGDSMELRVEAVLSGAPNSIDFLLDIPDGLTIDASTLTGANRENLGDAFLSDSGTAANRVFGVVKPDSSADTVVRIIASGNSIVDQGVPFTWASGDEIDMNFTVPILEWQGSASANFINDEVANQNAKVRYYISSTTSTTAHNDFDFDTESTLLDKVGDWSNTSGVITVPSPGTYRVTAAPAASSVGGSAYTPYIAIGGTRTIDLPSRDSTQTRSGGTVSITITDPASETISARATQTFTTMTATDQGSWIEIVRVPDFTAGQAVSFGQASAGNYGLVSYKEEDLDISGEASFTSGTIRIAKVNNVVTISFDQVSHPSSAAPVTASNFIPAEYQPSARVQNIYTISGSLVYYVTVTNSGQLQFAYRNWSGSSTAATNTLEGTMTWVI